MSNSHNCLACNADLTQDRFVAGMFDTLKVTKVTTAIVCGKCSHMQGVTSEYDASIHLFELSPKIMGKLDRETLYELSKIAMKITLVRAYESAKTAC